MTDELVVEKKKDYGAILKDNIELLEGIFANLKKDVLESETEKIFLDKIGKFLEEKINLSATQEIFDGILLDLIVNVIDKKLLDPVFGEDWFVKLKQFVEESEKKDI